MTHADERFAKQEERRLELQEEKRRKDKEKAEREREFRNFKEKFEKYYKPYGVFRIPDYITSIISDTTKAFSSEHTSADMIYWTKFYEDLNPRFGRCFNYSKIENCLFYNLYYLPVHFLKLPIFFYNLFKEFTLNKKWFNKKDKIRILDLGSGPGTMILAFLDFCNFMKSELKFNIPEIEVYAIEREPNFIKILNKNLENWNNIHKEVVYSKKIISDWADIPDNSIDLIIASNVLKEIKKQLEEKNSKVNYENNLNKWLNRKLSKYTKLGGIFCCVETNDVESKAIFQLFLKTEFTDFIQILATCCNNNRGCQDRCGDCKRESAINVDYGPFVNKFIQDKFKNSERALEFRLNGFKRISHE